MTWKERAPSGLEWGPPKRFRLQAAAVFLLGTVAAGPCAHAAATSECAEVNGGLLNVEFDARGSETRRVKLGAGDALSFEFEAPAGPFGALVLLEGAGASRSLLVGPTGTKVSFVAPSRGTFGFEFSTEAAETASFTVACEPASASRRNRSAKSTTAPRKAGAMDGISSSVAELQSLEAAEFPGFPLETAVPAPSPAATERAPWQEASPRPSAGAPAPATALDMKMQWRGERYRVGPDGLEADHTASGVDAALNYKPLPAIMVGALAQFDQPSETLIGPPHAFSDRGWMAGPVANIKLAPSLTLDARAAWGAAENTADEMAARTVSIPRRMVSARLANAQSFGHWRFTPSISVNQFYAAPGALVPAISEAAVPAAMPSGRVDVGPELAYRIDLDQSMFIEPKAAVGSFWGIDSLSKLTPGTASHNDMRLKAEAGVTIGTADGTKLQAGGGVEEGEPGAANVWTGRLQLSVPMK